MSPALTSMLAEWAFEAGWETLFLFELRRGQLREGWLPRQIRQWCRRLQGPVHELLFHQRQTSGLEDAFLEPDWFEELLEIDLATFGTA